MSVATDYMPAGAATRMRPRRATRLPIVIVMICSFLLSGVTRYWADITRQAATPTIGGETATSASLGGMDSFALGLLLGGLRGPLVMMLWTASETAKTDKDLEDVDTQIEWIRLLQPEFDTVHIFQIWNKAYNISVQMASMANKYLVILSAMDYAKDVDRAKPDDINIVAAIAQLYFDKLGMSSEKYFYQKRVREQTLPATELLKPRSPGARRVRLDPILTSDFTILPDKTKPKPGRARPEGLDPAVEWDDGSELQYLPQFGPYPDGVSTFGLAYNYYKRAEVLQNVMKQHHDQLSDQVVDSRPALSLKFWGDNEVEQARRHEMEAFGLTAPDDVDKYLGTTTPITLDAPVKDASALKLAMNDYARATRLMPASLDEYNRHIHNNFLETAPRYRNYMEDIRVVDQLANADLEYLTAMVSPADQRADHLAKALSYYRESRRLSYLMLMRYYLDRGLVGPSLPKGYALDNNGRDKPMDELSLEQAQEVFNKASTLKLQSGNKYVDTDRYEFDRYLDHCAAREAVIAKALPAADR